MEHAAPTSYKVRYTGCNKTVADFYLFARAVLITLSPDLHNQWKDFLIKIAVSSFHARTFADVCRPTVHANECCRKH